MKMRLIICMLCALVFSACHSSDSNSKEQEHSKSFPFSDFNFLNTIYAKDSTLVWVNDGRVLHDTLVGENMEATIGGMDTLMSNGRSLYAVRIYTRLQGQDCHPCGARCLISWFVRAPGGQMKYIRTSVLGDGANAEFGSFGSFPEMSLVKCAKEKYAYLLQPGFTNNGETIGSLLLFEVDDSLDLHEVFAKSLAMDDNGGMCNDSLPEMQRCYSYDTEMKFVPSEANEHFDLTAHKKGTNRIDDKITNIDSTFYYTYQGDRYVLVKTEVK